MFSRRLAALLAFAVVTPLALAACGDGDEAKPAPAPSGAPSVVAQEQPVALPVKIKVTPAKGKKDVPISAEIGVGIANGKIKTVALRETKGAAVAGSMREDGSAWVPNKPLKAEQGYEATVTAADSQGKVSTATTTFTTMSTPGARTGTGLYLFSGNTYGVAMPVVAEFSPGIEKKDRAAVQKRMFVKSDPPQPGTWSWTDSGTEAYYRAPEYWKTGTKLTVRLALDGVRTGPGLHGDEDRAATVKIGRRVEMLVDNKTKQMRVLENGKTVKKMPVSLGKQSTPSSSGHLVVMEKLVHTIFDTRAELGPIEGYRTPIDFAQRLTWGGQFIHSAPWSVGDQGYRNVSHGCVNVAPSNAEWLFNKTLVGDPVVVKGTEDKLVYGDGFTPWDKTWKEFVKGSALPVPSSVS